jgi:hypothetical protein
MKVIDMGTLDTDESLKLKQTIVPDLKMESAEL